MPDSIDLAIRAIAMGVAASAAMDLWSAVLRRRFGIPTLDYALLGRWIGHFPRGRFVHKRIGSAQPVPGERILGYGAHYAIGVAFASLLLAIVGHDWVANQRSGRRLP